MNKKLTPAVRVCLAISIATGLYGVSFGALAVTSGLDIWQTMVLSLVLFSGGSQFGFIGVIGAGGWIIVVWVGCLSVWIKRIIDDGETH